MAFVKTKKTLLILGAALLGLLALSSLPFLAGWWRLEKLNLPPGEDIAVKAEVGLDKEKPVHIGDPIRYSVVVHARSPWRIERPVLPEPQAGGLAFELKPLGTGGRQRIWGGIRQQFDYELRFFDVGRFTVGSASVSCRPKNGNAKVLKTNTIVVTVRSLLPEDAQAQPELKDVKPPVALPVNYAGIAAGIIALAGLVFALCWLYRLWRRARATNATDAKQDAVIEPAHVIAYRELDALRASSCWDEADMETFFVRLSGCVRAYFQNRFGIKAPESTTEELLPVVSSHPLVKPEARPLLAELSGLWDLVKFGRHVPPREIMASAWQSAYRVVELTQAEEEPSSTGAEGEPSAAEAVGEVAS
ncbi:MAG: hypothetical protein ACM3ZC_00395 [Bacteroidota bacterium]